MKEKNNKQAFYKIESHTPTNLILIVHKYNICHNTPEASCHHHQKLGFVFPSIFNCTYIYVICVDWGVVYACFYKISLRQLRHCYPQMRSWICGLENIFCLWYLSKVAQKRDFPKYHVFLAASQESTW